MNEDVDLAAADDAIELVDDAIELVDVRGIVARTRLSYEAVRSRRARGRLPAPGWELSIGPVWTAEVIDEWAERVGVSR